MQISCFKRETALEMIPHIEDKETYFYGLPLSHEATFHVSGTVNRHNCPVGEVNILMMLLNMSVIH
jgi:hypothetical protein